MFHRRNIMFFACAVVGAYLAVTAIGAFSQPVNSTATATADCQNFPETNHQVCGKFLVYWQTHGGLAQQGFPISDVFDEQNAPPPAGDGKVHKVQYFERARFEEHLENQPPYDVLLGLLGSEQYQAKYAKAQGAQPLVINGKRNESQIGTYKPKDGFTFFVVDFTLTNTTGQELSANPVYLKVKTNAGFSYEYNIASVSLPKGLKLSKLAPGENTRAELVFEIPASEQPVTFIFEDFNNKFSVQF